MNSVEQNDRLQSLLRWRKGFAISAVMIPLALLFLFERQARRLDVLALYGKPVEAYVTDVSQDGTTVYYSYLVNGIEYSWSVTRDEAPYAAGQSFMAIYSPPDPSLSRPISRRSLAADEASQNRSFGWKIVLGTALVLAFIAGMTHRDLMRIRSNAPSEHADSRAYRRRIAVSAAFMIITISSIGFFHIRETLELGESPWLVGIPLGIIIGIISIMFIVAFRGGAAKTSQWSSWIMRWLGPIAISIALVRLIAFMLRKF